MSGSRLHPFVVTNTPNIGAPLDHSAAIELADTNKGFLPNRLTTAQRDAITNPAGGLLIFNTTLGVYQFYDGSGWTGISNGMVKLASGTVTTPVAFIDLHLPAGYTKFRLEVNGIFLSVADSLSLVTSADNGTTFLNDPLNADSVTFVGYLDRTGDIAVEVQNINDVFFSLGTPVDRAGVSSSGLMMNVDISPGSASEFASMLAFVMSNWPVGSGGPGFLVNQIGAFVNPSATVTPTKQRINLIRMLPYGNGDSNPPTSGETITRGSYILWGIAP